MLRLSNLLVYFSVIFAFIFISVVSLLYWGIGGIKNGADHFAAISLSGDVKYYRNWGDRVIREIQDRDILYHNIGKSIEYARAADIIILGHSMLLFGLRNDLIEKFEKKYNIKIYNMASAGDGSGEFLLRTIKRWKIKPKLWIINADDHAANFFSVSLDDFGASGKSSAINVVKYGRMKGYMHVIGRNLRWRLEDILLANLPANWSQSLFHEPILACWRNIQTGNWYLDRTPSYVKLDHPLFKLLRPQDCHADVTEIERAKHYLTEIGGQTILMLVPYQNFCSQRVHELAKALSTEAVVPPDVKFSSWDGSGHLDKKGAIAFTKFFLSALEKTDAFKKLMAIRSVKNVRISNASM